MTPRQLLLSSLTSETSQVTLHGRSLTVPQSPLLHTRIRSSMRQGSTLPSTSTSLNKGNVLAKGSELLLVQNKSTQPKPFHLRTEQRRERVDTADPTKDSKLPHVSQAQLPPQHAKVLKQKSRVLTEVSGFVLNSVRQQNQIGKHQLHEQKRHFNKGYTSTRKVQSSRPLTEPQSPALRVKIRHQQRLLQRQERQRLAMTPKAVFESSQPMTSFVGVESAQLNRDLKL